jgi:L-fuculose-phosphate aldolase
VPCATYATFGTEALARAAAEALKDRTACLLANHGMICYGPTIEKAVALAAKLETLARQYWMSSLLGSPVLLAPGEMAAVRERYSGYGKSRLATADRVPK